MLRLIRALRGDERGFTIIELPIAMGGLAVLAGVVVFVARMM